MGGAASLAGHLVFSTVRTNPAPKSVTRLLDLGIEPFNFADALLDILARRLAKKLCDCRQAYAPSAMELKHFVTEYAHELQTTESWTSTANCNYFFSMGTDRLQVSPVGPNQLSN